MKNFKIWVAVSVFLSISMFTFFVWSTPPKATADENVMLAQAKTPQTAPVKIDCQYVEEKGKDGKIIIKLIGKDCDQAMANWEKVNEGQKVCCTCYKENGVWICHGSPRCCKKVPDMALPAN